MRSIAGFLLVVGLPLTAAAQPGMAPTGPGYAPAPAPAPVVDSGEPKARIEIGLVAASPRGDWKDQLQAETSPGLALQLGYAFSPSIGMFIGFRYLRVRFAADSQFEQQEGIKITHQELQIGLRFSAPVAAGTKLFVEGDVHSGRVGASFQGEHEAESGSGVGVRGGLMIQVGRSVGLGAAVGYTATKIGDSELDDQWVTVDGFLGFGF